MVIKKYWFLFFTLFFLSFGLKAQEKNYRQKIKEAQKKILTHHKAEHLKLKNIISKSETAESEEYSIGFKKLNLSIYTYIAKVLIKTDKSIPETHSNRKLFLAYKENLSQLEYEESKAEKIYDLVQLHFKKIEDKKFHGHWRIFVDYISWQNSAELVSSTNKTKIVITNKGLCPGGSYAIENKDFSFFIDGCFVLSSGEINSIDPLIDYTQSDVSALGLKNSLGFGYFASSSRSEIGFKLSSLYVVQELEDPPTATGYKVKQGDSFIPLLGFYSRWPIGKYFLQTEFNKFLTEDRSLWTIGFGYKY